LELEIWTLFAICFLVLGIFYIQGHIKGAVSLPLGQFEDV
jgi:hypothetical protein